MCIPFSSSFFIRVSSFKKTLLQITIEVIQDLIQNDLIFLIAFFVDFEVKEKTLEVNDLKSHYIGMF